MTNTQCTNCLTHLSDASQTLCDRCHDEEVTIWERFANGQCRTLRTYKRFYAEQHVRDLERAYGNRPDGILTYLLVPRGIDPNQSEAEPCDFCGGYSTAHNDACPIITDSTPTEQYGIGHDNKGQVISLRGKGTVADLRRGAL